MIDIPNYETFVKIEPITKGWSSDQKFYIETIDGEHLLLRLAKISEYEQKEIEFGIIKRLSSTKINMSQPIDFGVCENGDSVYQLLTWCEGEEAKVALAELNENEQYQFGIKAGITLKKINAVETYEASSSWKNSYGEKIDNYIDAYRKSGIHFENDELFISFLENNKHLMNNRPMCLTHEDFQTDNLVISPNKELYVIDFQQCGIVDPYYSLMSAMVSADESPNFAKGQIDEYFGGDIPKDFWQLFLFYFVAETIHYFSIAITLGQEEADFAYRMIENTLHCFDNLSNPVPKWYI